ncbi:hypothetical protein R80B4_01125 [Fibrobacteres bacterium R8-0-B4]
MIIERIIITVEEMLNAQSLTIPDYQRPYKWSEMSIWHLVNDIKGSMVKAKNKYRIGTIILHKDNGIYNIVDGQQRLISLTILLYALGKNDLCLLDHEFSTVSQDNIKKNRNIISELLKKVDIGQQQKYKDYILKNCEFVKMVTDSEQEAFQLFDSQNSRGKPLYPHDILKAYHLREMVGENNVIDDNTKDIINGWENIDKERYDKVSLADLFEYYIYPIKQWIRLKDGLGKTPKKGILNFDSKKIDAFKGIKADCSYNFAKYHLHRQGSDENSCENIFQLNQVIIAGKPFFHFVQRYHNLLEEIQGLIKKKRETKEIPDVPNENYVKKMYASALLLYADRFHDDPNEMTEAIDYFFRWAYYLRINMDRVGELSINKYAIEEKMFQKISDAIDPDDIFSTELPHLAERHKDKKKYSKLYEHLNGEKAAN